MKRKLILFLIISLIVMSLSGCNSSKLDENSKLNKNDIKILKKNYDDFTKEEQIRYLSMRLDMSEQELENFKDDLGRIYYQEHKDFYNEEEAKEAFQDWYDSRIRDLRGELTEEEKASKDELSMAVKEEVDKSREDIQSYVKAEKEIQDKLNKYAEENIDKIKEIKSEASPTGFRTKLIVKPLKDITVGEINNFRIAIADIVMETVEIEEVEVKLYMGSEEKDTYTFKFGSGWDKKVTP